MNLFEDISSISITELISKPFLVLIKIAIQVWSDSKIRFNAAWSNLVHQERKLYEYHFDMSFG